MTNNLPEQSGNHQRKAINREGPKPLGEISPRALSLREAIPYFQQGAALLDTRSKDAYVAAHVPGSVHLEADEQLSNRVGLVLPPEVPIILFVEDAATYERVVYALARVGYENVIGYLPDGMQGWQAAGLPVTRGDIQDITSAELNAMLKNDNAPIVVDVREPWEYALGHVPNAILIPLGQLAARVGELDPNQPVAVICEHGNRSQSAAAFLGQNGFKTIYNVLGGTEEWQMSGLPISRDGK